eukprot:XP_001708268.1 Hypothetical protein GL50803_10973 [Giardia lamblia ATCC 50803]
MVFRYTTTEKIKCHVVVVVAMGLVPADLELEMSKVTQL